MIKIEDRKMGSVNLFNPRNIVGGYITPNNDFHFMWRRAIADDLSPVWSYSNLGAKDIEKLVDVVYHILIKKIRDNDTFREGKSVRINTKETDSYLKYLICHNVGGNVGEKLDLVTFDVDNILWVQYYPEKIAIDTERMDIHYYHNGTIKAYRIDFWLGGLEKMLQNKFESLIKDTIILG